MIPISCPLLGEEEAQAAAEVIRSGWVAQGEKVLLFEQELARYLGVEHAVAVSSGTAALHLALLALGLGPGDEVLVPSLSFVATANAVLYVGATPVFVDVQVRTFNLDPERLVPAITEATRAILPVHQLGLAADLHAIHEVADRHDLLVVEDAACALGCTYRERRLGGHSAACCFSFHPRKVITTGEGGLVTTRDPQLASRLRVLRSQGASVPAEKRHVSASGMKETYLELGYNYRMTDIQAAVGLAQLRRLDGLLQRRRQLAQRYHLLLGPLPGLKLPLQPEPCGHIYQSYMVLLDHPEHRESIMALMQERGVSTRRAVSAIHLQPYMSGHPPRCPLPVTEQVARQGLMLPLYAQMTEKEQDMVVQALAEALQRFD